MLKIHFSHLVFFSLSLSALLILLLPISWSYIEHAGKVFYIRSQKKNPQLVYDGFIFNKKQTQANGHTTWRCTEMAKNRCRAVCITQNSRLVHARRSHHHEPHWGRFTNRELYTTEHEADVDAHGEIYTTQDPKLVVVGCLNAQFSS